ncbi:M1 family metallopeptidase [Hufsiella ginkgonis]|uniref:M1 family peptidase n=1 Tax=Hufsiella ginkgonis TaxID=2695274 RepID=A0A7K1XZ83_9SPHI|nr:M1 family metallopeptidase [Hufsiella ginkgonis]MXV16049.1 M1 family peptidase [Hufsiella ginkgonis]
MKKLFTLALLTGAAFTLPSYAQLGGPARQFTRADTLRGMLTPLRTCYDINYYHLDVKVNIDEKFINGTNLFKFTATQDFKRLQFDLFQAMKIEKILYKGAELTYTREFNAVFVDFPQMIRKGAKDEFTVIYSGNPAVARRAPWDGGFVFSKDQAGKPWVATAVQGFGASSWWPTKDHQADEVDSMLISISAPKGLMDVSNGRLRSTQDTGDGYTKFNWFVSYPINNYTVSINIADYAHFSDTYAGEKGPLTLDFYVLREDLGKAQKHFGDDVKPMLKSFEYWFGPYPFYRDGYKLVEAPYLGMEHQSAVTYGNKFMKGYLGSDLSGTGYGMKWDYIIVHESGHEWFGNNVTAKDIADMWIHEGFTMYSEGLFVESQEGKEAGAKYIAGVRKRIRNRAPMIGPYNVNREGADIYDKGANLLHTVRSVINDDEKWRSILRGLNKDLGLKTTTTGEVVSYITKKSGKDLQPVFDQYLRYPNIPDLEYKKENGKVLFRWATDVKDFKMPIKVKFGETGSWTWITPTTEWGKSSVKDAASPLVIDTDNFYIKTTAI